MADPGLLRLPGTGRHARVRAYRLFSGGMGGANAPGHRGALIGVARRRGRRAGPSAELRTACRGRGDGALGLIIVQRGTAGRVYADDLREYGVEFTVAAETEHRVSVVPMVPGGWGWR
jgi:hypothetical protein